MALEFDLSDEAVFESPAASSHDDVRRELKDERDFPFYALTMRRPAPWPVEGLERDDVRCLPRRRST